MIVWTHTGSNTDFGNAGAGTERLTIASVDLPSDPRVDADWIAARLDDPTVRIVELDVSAAAYNSGHIPGALLWNAYSDLRHPDYSPVTHAELEALLRRSGLTRDDTVVFYGYASHLGFWLMNAYGHAQVRFMDGPASSGRERATS